MHNGQIKSPGLKFSLNDLVFYNNKQYIVSGFNKIKRYEIEDHTTEPPSYFWVDEADLSEKQSS